MTDRLSDLIFSGGAKISGLPQAANSGEPVTLDQLNALVEGLAFKDDVVAASTANISLASPGATIDGVTMSAGQRFLAKDQTTASANGVYIWNGAATTATRAADMSVSAEFNAAVVPVKPGGTANGGTTWRCTTADPTVGTTSVAFTSFNPGAGAATESAAGITEKASQAEVDAGTSGNFFVSPEYLAAWANRKLKNTTTIGDASATQIDVTHNFNTRDVQVEVYKNSGSYDTVQCDVSRPSVNAVRLNFAAAPALNALRVVILG